MEPKLTKIVVLAHPGSEQLVREAWERFCDYPLEVHSHKGDTPLRSILEYIMADASVDRLFVLVPANLVPVTRVSWEELKTPLVDVRPNGQKSFFGRIPICFDKELLVDYLPENDALEADAFVAKYINEYATRPLEVGHHFGNYFTKVLRPNPCENVIIEAFIRKRFVFSDMAGWKAVAPLLKKLLT